VVGIGDYNDVLNNFGSVAESNVVIEPSLVSAATRVLPDRWHHGFEQMTQEMTRAPSIVTLVVGLLLASDRVQAAQWQWSMPDGDTRAYLWIPPTCQRVRGVVFANHNMIEQGILEHPIMRQTLSDLGFAEVLTVPYFDATFDFTKGPANILTA